MRASWLTAALLLMVAQGAEARKKPKQADNASLLAPDPALKPAVGLTPDQRLALVVDLLNRNDERSARVELAELLRQEPARREALLLLVSIAGNPNDVMPRGSFSYVVEPGDTYTTLSASYLDDPYKFYALARLNGIAADRLAAGHVIQIPGRYREPVGAEEPRRRYGRRRTWRRRVASRTASAIPAAQPAAAAGQADPAAALRLRRQGLERMTAGQIDAAVTRLSRAQSLDPENKAIAADLARAKRIKGSVSP